MKVPILERVFMAHNLPCFIVVVKNSGIPDYRCGYVAVNHGNRYYGAACENLTIGGDVHDNGLNFSGKGSDLKVIEGADDLWFLGFDTNRLSDEGNPKSMEYCVTACTELARQLS